MAGIDLALVEVGIKTKKIIEFEESLFGNKGKTCITSYKD